jgi:hypothetical protein
MCSVDRCEKIAATRGWCGMHYKRWLRNGSVGDPASMHHRTCKKDGCNKRAKGQGWCDMHYRRWRRNGSVGPAEPYPKLSPEARFRTFFRQRGPDDCWIWLGAETPKGYGMFTLNNERVYAHRYSYELATGDVLGNREIDHRCHNRWCVNPSHLRPATHKQNCENKIVRNKYGRGVAKVGNRFQATVACNHLGTFDTAEEAAEVARLKRLELFTYNDHDRQSV